MSENKPPLKIHLQIGEDTDLTEHKFEDLVGVSWCKDKINDNDIPYILESEHERIVGELKGKMLLIKYQAEIKLEQNEDRPLSEDTIEAETCIAVIDELLKQIQ